ncbi:hypothetical protein HJC23_000650 [Cyclotella cryptica]|uniref:tRNA/rRNA methyltransferase SpoU type domain-containing protein n=1 Tax=Cyclotella cryptica TaxID=29204 RepID=A0ABD3Q7Y2_9STRA|eukprot:CCRYP_008076-RB/>CCRYP_008076-RB protein AED:0.24 eAED:0.24 QI:140/1/1/1/1/1/7/215/2015
MTSPIPIDPGVQAFLTLLHRSSQLLHEIDDIDWKSLVIESLASSTRPDDDDNNESSTPHDSGEHEGSDEESEDDNDLFGMLGGYESDEAEERDTMMPQDDEEWDDEEEEIDPEDEAALLKRAAAVHSALLLSIDSPLDSKASVQDTMDFSNLMSIVIDRSNHKKESFAANDDDDDDDDDAQNHLGLLLSYTLSPSTFDNRPKSFRRSQERWSKVCSTNALLAIQYLLHLRMQSEAVVSEQSSSVLTGWNSVILPLLLGINDTDGTHPTTSLLVKSDALREAVLKLTPSHVVPSSPSSDNITNQVTNTCNVCIQAIRDATSSRNVVVARQKRINVICQVLIHLLNNIPKLTKGINVNATAFQDHVSNALHQAVRIILHGICYETVYSEDNGREENVKVQPPMLSVEGLRIITGILLPKLYPPPSVDSDANKTRAKVANTTNPAPDERAIELWTEILMLLSPYSTELMDAAGETKRRRCKNWNHVAPLSATAILCVILPAFLDMELPTAATGHNSDGSNSNWKVDPTRCSRPALQASVWNLLRGCLGRCDDSPNFTGASRSGECGDGGGRGTSLLSRQTKNGFAADADNDTGMTDDSPTDQLLRRRSAHCLRLLVEHERERLKRESAGKRGKSRGRKKESGELVGNGVEFTDVWMKYILVFEMLEMEIELHLVDQVWPTMRELASQVICGTEKYHNVDDESKTEILSHLPSLVWEDIASVLKRVLLSEAPTLRKLGLYRFLKGDSGVDIRVPEAATDGEDNEDESRDSNVFMNKPKSKYKIKKDNGGDLATIQPAPLSVVSVAFVLDVVIVSYDSIIGTKVGTNMQIDEDGQLKSESITPLLSSFLSNYAITLAVNDGEGTHSLGEFINQVLGPRLVRGTKPRSLVTFFHSVAAALESLSAASLPSAVFEPATVRETIRTMLAEFSSGGAPKSLQDTLKHDLALALQHTRPWKSPDVMVVLEVLALFPPEESIAKSKAGGSDKKVSLQQSARVALTAWLQKLGNGSWAINAASACCSAFVLGDLMPFTDFDWIAGVNIPERQTGMALCTLATLLGNASETLWPAVFKGLQTPLTTDTPTSSFNKTNRSMILLEFGCRESVLSGIGNGDLVADNNQCLLPPPPNIEKILHNAVQFVTSQLTNVSRTLVGVANKGASSSSGANRSSEASAISYHVAMLVGQLAVLHQSFPSSVSIALAVNKALENAVESITSGTTNIVESQILLYAALSCGAEFIGNNRLAQITKTCETILDTDFSSAIGINVRKDTKQALRSISQYAKWGCLSRLIPVLKGKERESNESLPAHVVQHLSNRIIQVAKESVESTPVIALSPLFQSVVASGDNIITLHSAQRSENKPEDHPFLDSLQATIATLFAILDEENTSSSWVYMLHEICKLIFRPKLLREEYETAYTIDKQISMPVLRAFEKLLVMGGTSKPHICKTAVSMISSSWLGEEDSKDTGILAIPYRNHIIDLLIYKEGKVDQSALHQSSYQETVDGLLPEKTDVSSITRGFVLVFLSKLPSTELISKVVLADLVHFVIDGLLDIGCAGPAIGKPFISGSEEYARATRSWQALCLLSRFVTEDKAHDIATRVFQAMSNNTHGPVRYFIEVFAIQCTRKHPDVFGRHYIREINRTDLSLQYVSSLMVLGGNIIVGKYSTPFFKNSGEHRIKDVLCGVIPWLSSTQGFSRAIAQQLVHKLIPMVVDVSSGITRDNNCEDSAVFASIYSFLENNGEMSRLRAKQQKFFDSYDVDGACSLEGLLSIPVDDGEEANPLHLVEAIKDCLAEVYSELHDEDAPLWKQMEDISINDTNPHSPDAAKDDCSFYDEAALVNFQRKILPIDSLDLSIQSLRDQKLFNAAGKKKQNLIICATLVDKVPNLAGLARTAEIFAAKSLVMPNLLIRKQDDFKTISASANDWIEMEECKEEELLKWLYNKKSQGFTIVGLEQTSSSTCITRFRFPDKTVLLLGKEKEGIPVEFLSAVDQCCEIPQLGIIRSLNVHVTGAIAIWKYTEQMMRKSTK